MSKYLCLSLITGFISLVCLWIALIWFGCEMNSDLIVLMPCSMAVYCVQQLSSIGQLEVVLWCYLRCFSAEVYIFIYFLWRWNVPNQHQLYCKRKDVYMHKTGMIPDLLNVMLLSLLLVQCDFVCCSITQCWLERFYCKHSQMFTNSEFTGYIVRWSI